MMEYETGETFRNIVLSISKEQVYNAGTLNKKGIIIVPIILMLSIIIQ